MKAAWIEQTYDHTLRFDGQDDYVDIPKASQYKLDADFTIEAWVKAPCLGPIFSKTARLRGGNLIGKGLAVWPSRQMHYVARTRNGRRCEFGDKALIPRDDGWHHVVLVHTRGEVKEQIYIDGKLTSAWETDRFIKGDDAGDQFRIGYGFMHPKDDRQPSYFQGRLAEIRLWQKARTAEEIAATALGPLAGDEPGLVGYWPLNQKPGEQKAEDRSPNANHGGIVGATAVESVRPARAPTASGTAPPQLQDVGQTGIADYGYWWQVLNESEPPAAPQAFRRGRIWA